MCALATLYLLGRLDAVDVPKAVEFVLSCYNFDGGFGTRPGSESHAGQVVKYKRVYLDFRSTVAWEPWQFADVWKKLTLNVRRNGWQIDNVRREDCVVS
jgi:hypothetical protein